MVMSLKFLLDLNQVVHIILDTHNNLTGTSFDTEIDITVAHNTTHDIKLHMMVP